MIGAMFVMMLMTLATGAFMLYIRVDAVRERLISISYFRTYQGEAPEYMQRVSNAFNNMFQVPVLFYVAAGLMVALQIDKFFPLMIAWLFVLSRGAHLYILLTYNNVIHRLIAYLVGLVLVFLLWVLLFFMSP